METKSAFLKQQPEEESLYQQYARYQQAVASMPTEETLENNKAKQLQ